MTPSEHYWEAERLLGEASEAFELNPMGPAPAYLAAVAQAHATLATARTPER
jgi:hypothetical protein